MKRFRPFLLLPCLAASLFACDSGKPEAKPEAKPDVKAQAKPDVKAQAKTDVKAAESPKPEVTTAAPGPAAVPAPAEPPAEPPADPHADLVLDEMKDWYGLKVAEIDGWKPSFEADTVGIQWSKPGHVDVSMKLNAGPIEKVTDIDGAFVEGDQVAEDPPTKTAKGWYTTATTGDTKLFFYIRTIGKSYLACDTLLSRSEGDDRAAVPIETLVKICESPEPA